MSPNVVIRRYSNHNDETIDILLHYNKSLHKVGSVCKISCFANRFSSINTPFCTEVLGTNT